jgi:hypothetical protein
MNRSTKNALLTLVNYENFSPQPSRQMLFILSDSSHKVIYWVNPDTNSCKRVYCNTADIASRNT